MNKPHKIILALQMFSLGLMVPVLSLILLDRGATLTSLALLLAVYSATVILFELPSGICADLYGRKTICLLSCIFSLISYILILFASNMVWLVLVMIFNGMGRAFSSGSLDALIIDQAIEKHGDVVIAKLTSTMAALEGISLSVGSICGGFLSAINGSYQFNLVLRVLFIVLVGVLCYFFIDEKKSEYGSNRKELINIILSYKNSKLDNRKCRMFSSEIWLIFIGIFFTGTLLNTIEAYWQPAFKSLSSADRNTWLLGIISFLGFLAVAIGNVIIGRILNKQQKHWWYIYAFSKLIFGIMFILFSMQSSIVGFIFGYSGVYFLLGINNVSENTIINKLIPAEIRASVLSLSSFLLQLGALISSLFSSILINRLQFNGLWMLFGTLVTGHAIFIIGRLTVNQVKQVKYYSEAELISSKEVVNNTGPEEITNSSQEY